MDRTRKGKGTDSPPPLFPFFPLFPLFSTSSFQAFTRLVFMRGTKLTMGIHTLALCVALNCCIIWIVWFGTAPAPCPPCPGSHIEYDKGAYGDSIRVWSDATCEGPMSFDLPDGMTVPSFQRCTLHWISHNSQNNSVLRAHVSRTNTSSIQKASSIKLSRIDIKMKVRLSSLQLVEEETALDTFRCARIFRGRSYFIQRWHTKNFCHNHESMFIMWRALYDDGAFSASRKPRIVFLDDETVPTFMPLWEHITPDIHHIIYDFNDTQTTCFEEVVVLGYDLYPSIHKADAKHLQGYRQFWLAYAYNTTLAGVSKFDKPPKTRLLIVQRFHNRILLNQGSLRRTLEQELSNYTVHTADLSFLSQREQIILFHQSSVVVGVHSGALLHSMWMQPGSVLVQLLPYNTSYGTHDYAYQQVIPPYIINVEELCEKLHLRFVADISTDPLPSAHCKEEASIEYGRVHTGGLRFQCYFYANFTVDPQRTATQIKEQLIKK